MKIILEIRSYGCGFPLFKSNIVNQLLCSCKFPGQIRIQPTEASGLNVCVFFSYSKCNRPLIAATASSEVTQEHEGSQHRQGGGACSGSKKCGYFDSFC